MDLSQAAQKHTFDSTILREYDVRGIVGETLTPADMTAIGRAYGTVLREKNGRTAAVGYDGRLSSPELAVALCAGLIAAGVDVVRVGLGPTPMLYFAVHHLGLDGGLMVTGSHNPPEFNGVKMVMKGHSFFGADITRLGDIATTGAFAAGIGQARDETVLDDYIRRVSGDYDATKGLKVVWDNANGAAGEALQGLVSRLPGAHILLNETIDGLFPAHHPDPTVEKNLAQLKAAVAAHGADIGIAFDGDGDRLGVVDGQGRVLWGDQIMCILAREVLADLPGAVIIADVKASQVFFDEIERLGGHPVMWKTGHSLIKAKMEETGAPLAGEMSAHIFFKHRYYGFDDALYGAVRLLSVLAKGGESLSELRDRLPQMVNTPELRFECDDKRKFQVVQEVRERLRAAADVRVNDIDGVRVLNDDGWWLLRASNTQPVLVARCEAKDDAALDRLKKALTDQLVRSGIRPPTFD
ncbi:phosphoglucomutase/phosphomannomutase PgmG [Varunaivibrio sulfuroxidans]|uniref:Phosphomannomutase n=1 Tax=Varunaivibrio sulfuroxidans TaxID=1773489 RepID=A0A4R3J785_9PROT|nr:phosphomannomutase/phosphoglucomutase [Varunaivibrio sulfuroxidans]TCS61262.1 phosphomannomutase [Varunaivibrio sulfuroxidans]WES31118.1 phosphomannomutase/phosphoglucomutase [Varunaivibrio sulfuroxidans]